MFATESERRWRDVPGWEGRYQVSDDGRCRSLDRVVIALNPKGVLAPRRYRGTELRGGRIKNGYIMFCLIENCAKEHRYAHDLVLTAFVGPRPDGCESCHNNGIRSDNRLENLRWDTRAANSADRRKHGTEAPLKGEACSSAKLTDDAVRDIRENYQKGEWSEAARSLGVSPTTVRAAALGIQWRHVA